jgi:hypothetical protein
MVPYHDALQRNNTENSKQIFPEKELCRHGDLYIPTIDLLQGTSDFWLK